jgi:putative hydrolase of HD superfamily
MKMCLIHDLGEAFTGDIPTFLKSSSDEEKEDEIFQRWVDTFPAAQRTEWKSLLEEMKEMRTTEAKLWKALDKTEALISHNESDIGTWLPLEYDLQRTYGTQQVQFSSYMREFKKEIDLWTERKIEEEGNRTDSL